MSSRKHGSAQVRHTLQRPRVHWAGHPVRALGHSPGDANLRVIVHRRSASRCRCWRVGGLADRLQELPDDKRVGQYGQHLAATAALMALQDVEFEGA